MDINKLKAYSGHRWLQVGQYVAALLLDNGDLMSAIYDERNGHWLDICNQTEIGYLDEIQGQRIHTILVINSNQTAK